MNAWPIEQDRLRAEIVRVGASLFQRGYVHSSAGNISVRLDDAQGGGFLITPTDACLGFLRRCRGGRSRRSGLTGSAYGDEASGQEK